MPCIIIKMKKEFILICITLGVCLGVVSAIYPGECGSFEFPIEGIVNWTVQDNSTSIDGFSFTQNGTNITYCLSGDFTPDNFILTFYTLEGDPEVVIEHHYSGGSSSSSRTVYVETPNITYVEVPNYLDRVIYENNATEKIVSQGLDIKEKDNILKYVSWTYWYIYVIVLLGLSTIVYFWFKSFNDAGGLVGRSDKEVINNE